MSVTNTGHYTIIKTDHQLLQILKYSNCYFVVKPPTQLQLQLGLTQKLLRVFAILIANIQIFKYLHIFSCLFSCCHNPNSTQLNPISPGVLGPGNTLLPEIYIDFTRKKNWSKSQKVSDILRFENFLDLRFCHDLTHENGRNSLNF